MFPWSLLVIKSTFVKDRWVLLVLLPNPNYRRTITFHPYTISWTRHSSIKPTARLPESPCHRQVRYHRGAHPHSDTWTSSNLSSPTVSHKYTFTYIPTAISHNNTYIPPDCYTCIIIIYLRIICLACHFGAWNKLTWSLVVVRHHFLVEKWLDNAMHEPPLIRYAHGYRVPTHEPHQTMKI